MKNKYIFIFIIFMIVLPIIGCSETISDKKNKETIVNNSITSKDIEDEGGSIDINKLKHSEYERLNKFFSDITYVGLKSFEKNSTSNENLIYFSIRYNFIFNQDETIEDIYFMNDTYVNKTLKKFFNKQIDQHHNLAKYNITYKDGYYKINDDFYQGGSGETYSSFINRIKKIEDDTYTIYVTNYITYYDGQEAVLSNIKSIVKKNDKNEYVLLQYSKLANDTLKSR
ncbi:hypothetical protein [Dethiothermospora halolimnae]|uniref:hypothetical protein n=1 Tax=Dethiothermospora halolimnae TaxID=3114390 RepID=UPI003CCBE184